MYYNCFLNDWRCSFLKYDSGTLMTKDEKTQK